MKIPFINWILIIDILTLAFIPFVIFIPSDAVRIILGLPFLLYFPGYVLMSALFAGKNGVSKLEKVALSAGLSIAVVILTGFGLNYTSWGISVETAFYSIAGFILLFSAIALIRRSRIPDQKSLFMSFSFKRPEWKSNKFNKVLGIVLTLAVVGALGFLGYAAATVDTSERYTEFYILGLNGQARDYPTDFLIRNDRVISVGYDKGVSMVEDEWGKVTLVIVSHEQHTATYEVEIRINNEPVNILVNGNVVDKLPQIELPPGGKWEQVIGFAPQNSGSDQRVDFLLSRDGTDLPENSLHLQLSVTPEQ